MAKPEEENQAAAAQQPAPAQPTRNLREFYQAQPSMGDTIRGGMERAFPNTVAQGRDVEAKVGQAYRSGGLISAASEASKRALQPAIGVGQDVASAVGAVGRLLNPFAKTANAQPAPTPATPAATKQPTVQKPAAPQSGSMLGLTPVSMDKMWNTPLNQPKPAAPAASNARSRPTVPGAPKPQAAPVAAPIQAAAAPAAQAADDSVIIDRGIGRPGSTMAMIDHETGSILTAGGGTDTYRPFEGEYMTQGRQDEITANRLKVGDPMTVGQAGAISKQAALITDRNMAETAATQRTQMTDAGATQRTGMTIQGSMSEAQLRESGLWGRHNSAMKAGENQNKLKEELAKLDMAIIADPENEGLRAKRNSLMTKSALAEKDILDSYAKAAEMGGPAEGMSYQEYRASIMGGGPSVTKEQVDAAAAAQGISDPAQLQQLYKTYGVQ